MAGCRQSMRASSHPLARENVASPWVFTLVVGLVIAAILAGTSAGSGPDTSTTTSGVLGVVTGYVTVGPSQPVCQAGQACNLNMSGYSVVFTLRCATSQSNCQASKAPLSPGGHYSILLPPGSYAVTGLSPSCQWMGCSSAFPNEVEVQGGMQIVLNFDIDTGIR